MHTAEAEVEFAAELVAGLAAVVAVVPADRRMQEQTV